MLLRITAFQGSSRRMTGSITSDPEECFDMRRNLCFYYGLATIFIIQTGCHAAVEKSSMCSTKPQIVAIAADYIKKNVPPAVKDLSLPAVVEDKGGSWRVYYELPPNVAGGTADLLVDKTTCEVIKVELGQ
jgi:hypothetical protein